MYFSNGLRAWWNWMRFIAFFFSLGILVRTLFSGWRRDSAGESFTWWQKIILALIFIFIGCFIRLIVIALGFIVLLLSIGLLPVFVLLPIRPSYESLVKFGSIGKSWAYGDSYALHKYGHLLYTGPDHTIYGRTDTVDLMTRVLSRDDHNNVLLVGAPGSGRRTIVAQFAKNVYRGLVPPKLQNKEVIEVLLEGMTMDILSKMFDEAGKAGNIILVFTDLEKYEGMFAHIMPLLSSKELEVIALASYDGYHSSWKENADVMRYFERVEVPPLTIEDTIDYLATYAREHYPNIRFEEGVFAEIVQRTNELIQHKSQPEKSMEVLQNAVINTNEVSIESVRKLLSAETGIPLGSLERDEKQLLLTLEDELRKEVVGQEEAIHDISGALRRARAGISSKNKPIGTFLFLGPTGSGKTHTGEMLAKHFFGGRDSMVRFDMSEFAVEGSEPGFIERLAVAIEENPYGLIFFDEIEKAHRAVWNVLLQVLDEGRLTTTSGRTMSFINTIIIATSNAGTALIEQKPQTTKEALMAYLVAERLFSPEFLNRFDDVVVFHPLTQENAQQVVRLLLASLNARLSTEKNLTVSISDAVVDELVQEGYSVEYGARSLRRVVQEEIEGAVAERILRDQAPAGSVIQIDSL